jgi:hypothetical protein
MNNEKLSTEDKIALAIGTAYAKELNEKVFKACLDECAAKLFNDLIDKKKEALK